MRWCRCKRHHSGMADDPKTPGAGLMIVPVGRGSAADAARLAVVLAGQVPVHHVKAGSEEEAEMMGGGAGNFGTTTCAPPNSFPIICAAAHGPAGQDAGEGANMHGIATIGE